jgi:hypothetical protein
VLVRHDLPTPQIAVQAVHAALEASRQFLPPDSEHPHVVLCGVASEAHLLSAADHLFRWHIRCALFREPDRAQEATALATEPLWGERRRLLQRFRCLRREDFLVIPASEQESKAFRQEPP